MSATRVILVLAAGAAVLVVAALVVAQGGDEAESSAVPEAVGVALMTESLNVAQSTPLAVTIAVFNGTQEQLVLGFRDSQRYDLTVRDEAGEEVWRWSDGKAFLQALGSEGLGPDRPLLPYEVTCEHELEPGAYTVTGEIPAMSGKLSASLSITVK